MKYEIRKVIAGDHLTVLNEFKSPGLNKLHPRLWRDLADVIKELLSVIFKGSWRIEKVLGP